MPNTPDVYPIDYATPVGQVRNLIADTEQMTDPANPDLPAAFYLNDGQLQAFIATARGKIYIAAALALNAMATNEAIVSKKIRTEDLTTDGPAVATALRQIADGYRTQQKEDDLADDYEDAFAIVDYTYYPLRFEVR